MDEVVFTEAFDEEVEDFSLVVESDKTYQDRTHLLFSMFEDALGRTDHGGDYVGGLYLDRDDLIKLKNIIDEELARDV